MPTYSGASKPGYRVQEMGNCCTSNADMATMAVENVMESDRDELKQIINTMWARYGGCFFNCGDS